MKSSNYVVIQGWMCNELKLKGNELLTFALIYGFSQDEETNFHGSRTYIAETFNISLPTVDKALESLEDKNLIEVTKVADGSGIHNEYAVCKETLHGVVKKLYRENKETLQGEQRNFTGGSKETLHNNTSKYTTSKKDKENKKIQTQQPVFEFGKQKAKKDNLFTKCVNLIDSYDFSTWGNIRNLLIEYLQYRIAVKDKPLYSNMWKGMLDKLCELCDNDIVNYESVIKQSIEKGYLSFYPINGGTSRTESGTLHVPVMTENDYAEEEKEMAKLEAQGIRVRF